jgi:hypothetical protein
MNDFWTDGIEEFHTDFDIEFFIFRKMLQEIFDIVKRWKVEGDNRPFFTHKGKISFLIFIFKEAH